MNPNPYAAQLRLAIRNTLTPDPYTVVPAGEVVEAIALGVELQCAVSHKRRPDRAANPWLTEPAAMQLDHAFEHAALAWEAETIAGPSRVDSETGLPHIGHAMLRLSFANARQVWIGEPDRSCETCAYDHREIAECADGCACVPCRTNLLTNYSRWVRKP